MRTVIQFHKLILLFLSLLSATSEVTVSIQDSYKNIVPIYTNNMLSQQFNYNQNIFCCYNHYIFTYNQTYSQYQANTPYNLYISNITGSQPVLPISISITTYNVFNTRLKPTLSSTTCLPPSCTIAIYNNCQKQQSYDAYQISISNIPIITYNVLCNTNITISPFQGGLIILVCICVAQIIINSMFQQANSFNNKGHYINWMSILIFCIVTIIGQILILVPFSNRMYPLEVLQYTTMVLSFLGSIIGIWVCVCQFLYYTKIGIFRRSLNLRKFKIRLMDIVGIVIGIVLFLYWAFVNINWIISDIMYFAMCTAIIKFIKFDSLRIATFMFICVAGIDLFFILFLQFYQHQYFNNIIMTYFNNPFFIMCPIINYVPNQQCSWFFIGSVAFPGILLAYFRRFDQNNGSRIYTTIFIVIYCIFSAVWIGIIFVTPIVFPYNMINSPICIVVIVIFAKKRGEIYQLWTGKIYDAKHKNRKQAEKEIQNMIKSQKTHTYNTQLFKINLSISSSGTQEMQQNLRNFQLKETILRENTSMKNCRSSI